MEKLISTIKKEKGTTRKLLQYDAVSITRSTFVNSYFYVKHQDDETGLMLMISNVGQEFAIANVTQAEYIIASRTPLPTPRKTNSFGSYFYWNFIATDRVYDDPEVLYGIDWPSFFPIDKEESSFLDILAGRMGEIEQAKRLLDNPQEYIQHLVEDKIKRSIIEDILLKGYETELQKMKTMNTIRKIAPFKSNFHSVIKRMIKEELVKKTRKISPSAAKRAKKLTSLKKVVKKIMKFFI